jgi:hypothetical protein
MHLRILILHLKRKLVFDDEEEDEEDTVLDLM